MTLALNIYLATTSVVGPVWRRAIGHRAARGKEDPARLAERFGRASAPRADGPLIWFHALGLGEAGAMLALIRAVQAARPDLAVLLTTNTRTGADGLAKLGLPESVIHQYAPIDTPGAVAAFLDHWRPDAFVLAELDLWPRMLRALATRRIPMAMVNARLTDHRFAGRMRLRSLFAPLFPLFRAILVQDSLSASRMQTLGAGPAQITVAGLLKAAADPLPARETDLASLRAAIGPRPVWLGAATHAREHAAILRAHALARETAPDLLLILAPRQLTDADTVARTSAEVFGSPPARRSLGGLPVVDDPVYLADSMGEMGLWYRLAPLAFVGHSLDIPGDPPLTGKNPFEAALLHCLVLHGPCTSNFAESYDALKGTSVLVASEADLAQAITRLFGDPAQRASRVTAADAVMAQSRAALPLTCEAVLGLLPKG